MSNSFRNEIRHFRKRIYLVAISVLGRWSNIFTNLSGFIVGDRFETFTFSARTMIHSLAQPRIRNQGGGCSKNPEKIRRERGGGWSWMDGVAPMVFRFYY